MKENFINNFEKKEILTKSGLKPEELFDNLVGLKSFGTEKDLYNFTKRKMRGFAKNVLRITGVSDEDLRKILPTRQTAFIKQEISGLSKEDQLVIMEKIVKMEQERINEAIDIVKKDINSENLKKVILLGSLTLKDKWPNDIDVNLIMKKFDKNLVNEFVEKIETLTFKKCDVKNVLES